MEFSSDLIRVLRAARHIAVLTGAGVSAESGIPTFRDAQVGLWAQYRPEDLATPEAFERNPRLVWDWYAWRGEIVRGARPNPGHYALAEMQRRVPKLSLITQNVDGFHQQAGGQEIRRDGDVVYVLTRTGTLITTHRRFIDLRRHER